MIYHREFNIAACHFNGPEVYAAYRELMKPDHDMPIEQKVARMARLCAQLLCDIHGHDFRIVVEVEDNFHPIDDHVVDHAAIEAMVMRWHNTNLSVHQDFKGLRATIENMSELLVHKLKPLMRYRTEKDEFIGPTITVEVYQTDRIFARRVVDLADEPVKKLEEAENLA